MLADSELLIVGVNMYKFIICDDEITFSKSIVRIVDSVFMKNDFDYSTIIFNEYNYNLEKIIKNHEFNKIYILDIEFKNGISGIDIARKIREHDWNSIIIMVTSHNEMGYEVLKAQTMVLDFISKFDNYKERLTSVIEKAINKINNQKVLCYKNRGITYRIDISNIIYILKEPQGKKCQIITTNGEYEIISSLNDIEQKLNNKFYFTHRSCIVNTEYIANVDWLNGVIMFKNGIKIDLLSRKRKKGLKEYVNV